GRRVRRSRVRRALLRRPAPDAWGPARLTEPRASMSANRSRPAPASGSSVPRVSRRAWDLVFNVLLVYVLLRVVAGPVPQWPDYHDFADTRVVGFVPRAGDVLTNLVILAAGLWTLFVRHRVHVGPDERPAVRLLIIGSILTAVGSAYYHWEPS